MSTYVAATVLVTVNEVAVQIFRGTMHLGIDNVWTDCVDGCSNEHSRIQRTKEESDS